MVYKPYKLNLTKGQIAKAVAGKPLRLKKEQINAGPNFILLHPSNYKLVVDAAKKNRGVTLPGLSPGEIQATQQSDLAGTGVFDWVKKAYNWTKSNWGTIKPVLSAVGDAVATVVPAAAPVRAQIKNITGVGAMPAKKKRLRGANGLYISNKGSGLYL